jgi:uncharacterized RDD family membrane protein YckC
VAQEYFSAPSHSPDNPTWELSGWWPRVGAAIIDSFVIFVPTAVVIGLIAGFASQSDDTSFDDLDVFVTLAGLVVGAVYYMWIMSSTNGQTVGKKVANIRVVREDGLPVDAKFAFVRETLVITLLFGWLGALVFFLPTILNYLWPLWDSNNQALHDKMVKSRVVRAAPVSNLEVPVASPAHVAPDPFAPSQPAPPPAAPSAPPPPPPVPGQTTPYTPPPGFENPVPDDDK